VSRFRSTLVALGRDWTRSREAVFFAFLFPIILLVIFSSVFAAGSPEFSVAVQNNDLGPDGEPTNLSATFVENLESVDVLSVRSLPADRDLTAWSRDRSTETDRVVVVPDGFAEGVRNQSMRVRIAVIEDTIDRVGGQLADSEVEGIRANLTRARNATNASGAVGITFLAAPDDEAAPTVRGIVDSVVSRYNQRAIGVEEPIVSVNTDTLGDPTLGAVAYFLPAFIAAVILINGVMTVPAVVAGFKHDGTLKQLVATPLRKREWILANVVHQSLVALLLMVEMVLVARLLYGVTAVPGPTSVALVLLGAVGFSALGIALGSLLPDPDAATSLGGLVAFPMMFLSGVFWEVDVMPGSLQFVAELMPLYHFHQGLRQSMIVESPGVPLVPFAVLGGLAVVSLVLAVVATDWKDLG
jgi:ABC-2 type transport system permease protein